LERLAKSPAFRAHFRAACGLSPVPQGEKDQALDGSERGPRGLRFWMLIANGQGLVFDLSAGSTFLGANPSAAENSRTHENIFHAK